MSFSCYYEPNLFFFFNDTATTEIYTLSLHDALPIWLRHRPDPGYVDVAKLLPIAYVVASAVLVMGVVLIVGDLVVPIHLQDRKSTRLNSSHANISYAVFCLKKKN